MPLKGYVWMDQASGKYLTLRGDIKKPVWNDVVAEFTYDVNKATVLPELNEKFRKSLLKEYDLVDFPAEMYVIRLVRLTG